MNNDLQTLPPIDQLSQAAKDAAQQAANTAKEAAQRSNAAVRGLYQTLSDKAEDGITHGKVYAQHATQTAKDLYQSAAAKAEDTLVHSKEYVRQNPIPVVLGALVVGFTLGCITGMSRREEPTLRERFRW